VRETQVRTIHCDEAVFPQSGAELPQVFLLHAQYMRKVLGMESESNVSVVTSSPLPNSKNSGAIHRVYKQRIDHEDLSSFVKGADNAPNQGACEIHGDPLKTRSS
jgi:hypothetical protein